MKEGELEINVFPFCKKVFYFKTLSNVAGLYTIANYAQNLANLDVGDTALLCVYHLIPNCAKYQMM
jgi:hypothetical protein